MKDKVISAQWWGDIPSEDLSTYPDTYALDEDDEDDTVEVSLPELLVTMLRRRKEADGAVQE